MPKLSVPLHLSLRSLILYFTCLKWVSHSNTALRALRLGGFHILVSTLIFHLMCWRSLGSQLADFYFVVIISSSGKQLISFIDYLSSYLTNCMSGSMIENWHKIRILSFIMMTKMELAIWSFFLYLKYIQICISIFVLPPW